MNQKHSGRVFPDIKEIASAGMLFFLTLLFLNLDCRGQAFFYFENKLPFSNNPAISQHSFLMLESDGTATARIWYTKPGTNDTCLFECSLADSIFAELHQSDERKYLVPNGEPRIIKGLPDTNLSLPRYIFNKQVGSGAVLYVPVLAEYKTNDGIWLGSEMILNKEKNLEDLSKEPKPLLQFYNREDDFFKYVIKPVSRGGPTGIIRKEKLYLIVVANTNDTSIGPSVKKDLENITKTFTGLTKDLGMEMIPTIISGDAFSKNAVELALSKRTLKPAPIDIVVFYYSGHGFRYSDDTSRYPRMSLRTDSKTQKRSEYNLRVEEIYQTILKRGARVNIVLSDCCNENVGYPRPEGKDILTPRGSETWPGKLNMENCNALLFPEKPVSILIGSAEKDQLASGNPNAGGYFTSFFRSELEKSLYGFQSSTSWKKMLLSAKEKARYMATSAICGNGRCVQRAEIRITPDQ
jgi:hypothetical protein